MQGITVRDKTIDISLYLYVSLYVWASLNPLQKQATVVTKKMGVDDGSISQ